ncbi:pyridoxamine phosphate oxidase [Hirsutella rhossiliensis]|uniref:Pyridoxamine phosphate oxidase n=1 Tax=Hirsutella rhossiliensis TaxID=111463 RepID=A0A9P8SJ60_9HYPO|nr:pyridoxamine phosphate oxidase [Hirsutella rhossiliensis]KAH0964546.1 pyridoxamine phosphate oxidase [Hirsutella rhossiliensis]
MIRQRHGGGGKADATRRAAEPGSEQPRVADGNTSPTDPGPDPAMADAESARASWTSPSHWIFFAIASGACAAVNGAFAKLTTTSLTSTLARSLAALFGLSSPSANNAVELTVRGIFFALNLTFNGIMWTLFTTALAKGTSTTQVSIMNTSTNFVLTALLGLVIFSEALPPLWWAGAALLVAGNVVIGSKVEPANDDHDADDDDNPPDRRGHPSAASAASSESAAEAGEWKPLLQSGSPSGETSYANSVDEDAPHLGYLSSEPLR